VVLLSGLWQVAHETSRLPLKILSNMSAWPNRTSAGSALGNAASAVT
jgi:hypothetical protein